MTNTLQFLEALAKNNNRSWFQHNKALYEKSHLEMIHFAEKLIAAMNTHDLIETASGKQSLMRIYRDVRFSKDKTPYKTNWGGGLKRLGADRRGGYYYQVGVNGSFVMGGFFGPSKEDLLHIRKHIAQDSAPLRAVVDSGSFKKFFGNLLGTQLKTTPKGFDKDHPNIDLLRYKQFMVRHDFNIKQVTSTEFPGIVSHTFLQMRPFFDCMTEILTTDLNGESLI